MYDMTIVFLNTRFSDFYSEDIFRQVKERYKARFVAIIDEQFYGKIGKSLYEALDETIVVAARSKNGFLAEFDFDSLQPLIEAEMSQTQNLRIVCSDEFNLLDAGKLRRLYQIPGHTDAALLPFRDKVKMKSNLQAEGIRVPKYTAYDAAMSFEDIKAVTGAPFVLKPIDSSGSHGVVIVKSASDYLEFMQAYPSASGYQAEEYIEGSLYHVDTWIQDGQLKFICANEYTCPNADFVRGAVLGSIPLSPDSVLGMRLQQFADQVLRVLNADNMVSHMELFHTVRDEIVFLEVSARPPGALINLTHRVNFNINLADVDFCLQTGLPYHASGHFESEKCCWAMVPLKPGRVISLHQPVVNSRVALQWFVKDGTTISPSACRNIIAKAGQMILYNHDMAALRQDFESLRAYRGLEVAAYDQAG